MPLVVSLMKHDHNRTNNWPDQAANINEKQVGICPSLKRALFLLSSLYPERLNTI